MHKIKMPININIVIVEGIITDMIMKTIMTIIIRTTMNMAISMVKPMMIVTNMYIVMTTIIAMPKLYLRINGYRILMNRGCLMNMV